MVMGQGKFSKQATGAKNHIPEQQSTNLETKKTETALQSHHHHPALFTGQI